MKERQIMDQLVLGLKDEVMKKTPVLEPDPVQQMVGRTPTCADLASRSTQHSSGAADRSVAVLDRGRRGGLRLAN
jgi:hypothetical protein